MSKDIRWQQRFGNYQKALKELNEAVALAKERTLSKLEKQGLIQAYEVVHELSWKVMKDFLTEKGETIFASKDATRAAFKSGLITSGEDWMQMIEDRNLTSHTYNQEVAQDIVDNIIANYAELFQMFERRMAHENE